MHAADPAWLEAERITNGTNHADSIFPWTPETSDDTNKAVATIGQLKAVFSLRFATLDPAHSLDSDGDGLPNEWEILYGLNWHDAADALADPDADGRLNLQEFQEGKNPLVYDVFMQLMRKWSVASSWVEQVTRPNGTVAWRGTWSDGSNAAQKKAHDQFQHVLEQRDLSAPNDDSWSGCITDGPNGVIWLHPDGQWQGDNRFSDTTWEKNNVITRVTAFDAMKYQLRLDRGMETGPELVKEYVIMIYKEGLDENPTLISLDLTIAKNQRYSQTVVVKSDEPRAHICLVPMELTAFKRGTLNAPGAEVPAGTGEFGYETVMMENADSESADTSTSRDCDESGDMADLNADRKIKDDDLVKIVLRWPVGIKPAGASLQLLHDGMQVDARQTTADAAVSISGPSQLNFYKADGTRITDPTTDLHIADLANAPASSYLSKILTDGEVTIFIEGADRFGDLPANYMDRLGGAQLRWEFTQGATTATAKLLVYRGGFLRFMQPAGAPGTVGDFEFWDGKGRVKNKVGKPIFGKEFEMDVTDYGTKLATWKAKSGKTKNNPKYPGGPYNKKDKHGHTPPGWWRQYRSNKEWTKTQQDQSTGAGATRKTEQGGYVRWKQDDETDPAKKYTNPYRYDASLARDNVIGEPIGIKFKYDMDPIAPSSYQGRSDIQIHPDGECNDNVMGGTAGCIGVQTYKDCQAIDSVLTRYHGLKVKVQLK